MGTIINREFFSRAIHVPRRKRPWEEGDVLPNVMKVIKGGHVVREALLEIGDKCGEGLIKHAFGVANIISSVSDAMHSFLGDENLLVGVALTHDVGKKNLPRQVLLNSGKLSFEERELVRKHPKWSCNFLRAYGAWEEAEVVVRHHECAKNYPRSDSERRRMRLPVIKERRSGCDRRAENSRYVRLSNLLSIADIMESMSSERPYIQLKNKRKTLVERVGELHKFSSDEERRMINLLVKGGFKVITAGKCQESKLDNMLAYIPFTPVFSQLRT